MLCCDAKHMKYLLVDEDSFSLKFGGSRSFDQSLFTDGELDKCEPDLTLMTQRTERKTLYYRRFIGLIMRLNVITCSIAVLLSFS